MEMRIWVAWVVVVVLGSAGCAHGGGGTEPDVPAVEAPVSGGSKPEHAEANPASRRSPEADRAHHMQASFFMALDARDALVHGDLESARRHAKQLVQQSARVFPEAWKPYVARMKQYADDLVLAPDAAAAARSLGQLGVSCGTCHWHTAQGPQAPREPPLAWKDTPEDVDERMFRHDVGADQMWTGLVVPSERDFRAGTVTLTRAPLPAPARAGETMTDLQHAALERIRGLAKQARGAPTHEQRGELFGQIVTECHACHQVYPRTGDGPDAIE